MSHTPELKRLRAIEEAARELVEPANFFPEAKVVQLRIKLRDALNVANIIEGSEADARLIAAAPDLLEALEAVVAQEPIAIFPSWHEVEIPTDVLTAARAAIAKANGA